MKNSTYYSEKNVSDSILKIAKKYQKLLPNGLAFSHYVHFEKDYLSNLPKCVHKHFKEEAFPRIFSEVANTPEPTIEQRKEYLQALLDTYKQMESYLEIGDNTSLIAPEREGALLTKRLGWDKKVFSAVFPHAKRILYDGGIVVGLVDIDIHPQTKDIIIVDGAIASGSTLMAIMQHLKNLRITKIRFFAIHGTEKSIYILDRFARDNNIDLEIHIAFISGILNEKYYAVYQDNNLIVGDLGDTISNIVN